MHFEGQGVKLTNRVYAMVKRRRETQENNQVIEKMFEVSKLQASDQVDNRNTIGQQHQQNYLRDHQTIEKNPQSQPNKNIKRHVRSGSAGDTPARPTSNHLPQTSHKENNNIDGWSQSQWSSIPEFERQRRLKEQLLRQERYQKDLLSRIKEQQLLLRQKAIHEDSVRREFCQEIERIDQLTSKILARRNY